MLASANENVGIFDHKAIPTARFGKLAVAVTLSASTAPNSQLVGYWARALWRRQRARGRRGISGPKAGTHIYIVDLSRGRGPTNAAIQAVRRSFRPDTPWSRGMASA